MKKFKSYNHLLLTLSTFVCGSLLTFASTIPVHIAGAPLASLSGASTYISDSNRVMLPFRAVSKALDIDIQWLSPYIVVNGTHALTGESVHIQIKANESKLLLNNTPYLTDQAIEIVDGHSYIPIRLFAEMLGYDVAWVNQSVYITLPTPIEEEEEEVITTFSQSNTTSSYSGGSSSNNSNNSDQSDDDNTGSDLPSNDNDNNDSDLPSDDNNNNDSDLPSDDNDNNDSDLPSDDNNNNDSDLPSDDNNNNDSDLPSDDNNNNDSDLPSDDNNNNDSDLPSDDNDNSPSWPNFPSLPNKPTLPEIPAPPAIPDESPVDTRTQYENEVLTLVNKERQKAGVKPLEMDERVRTVAREKSKDMSVNNYLDHNSPTYGSPFDMLKKSGINYASAAENIAAGYQTPKAVVEGWMNSSGHRQNILNGNLTHIGIGYYASGNYWTQMFITPR